LYSLDLTEEAIEICRLSLWIKTAHRGKTRSGSAKVITLVFSNAVNRAAQVV